MYSGFCLMNLFSCSVLLWAILSSLAGVPARGQVSFTRDLAPILLKRCTGCHGERANLGGYRVHTFENLRKGGASGKAPIVPGKPDASRLYQLITAKPE